MSDTQSIKPWDNLEAFVLENTVALFDGVDLLDRLCHSNCGHCMVLYDDEHI